MSGSYIFYTTTQRSYLSPQHTSNCLLKCPSSEEAIFATQETMLKENGSASLYMLPWLWESIWHHWVTCSVLRGSEWKDLHGGLWKIGIPKEDFMINLCYNTPLPHFQPHCGIQQGSFFSHTFFLLVIDQMLQRLQQSNCRATPF